MTKRVMTGLATVAAGAVASLVFAGTAHADPGAPWVFYKSIPGGVGDCNSAGVYFEQEGLITDFVCANVQPPSYDSGGYSNMWVIFP